METVSVAHLAYVLVLRNGERLIYHLKLNLSFNSKCTDGVDSRDLVAEGAEYQQGYEWVPITRSGIKSEV